MTGDTRSKWSARDIVPWRRTSPRWISPVALHMPDCNTRQEKVENFATRLPQEAGARNVTASNASSRTTTVTHNQLRFSSLCRRGTIAGMFKKTFTLMFFLTIGFIFVTSSMSRNANDELARVAGPIALIAASVLFIV